MRILAGANAIFSLSLVYGRENTNDRWIHKLESEGYTVKEGVYDFFTMETCKNEMDTCYAQNAATPYGLMFLPRAPGEVEANFSNWCAHGLCRHNEHGDLSPAWRVKPGETILLIGRTPPESRYWSFANSLFSRMHPQGWKPSTWSPNKLLNTCTRAKNGPNRCEVFSGMNDPLNHLTVNVGDSPSPFKANFGMLMTWDTVSESHVLSLLQDQAVAGNFDFPMNTLRFPGETLKLGVTSGDEDDFIMVARVAGISNESDRKEFYSKTWGMRAFRISPPEAMDIPNTAMFGSFRNSMRKRETGVYERTEALSHEELLLAYKQLQESVRQAHSHVDVATLKFDSFVQDSGYECLDDGTKCQGDCRDTVYAKATFLVQQTICEKTHLPCSDTRSATLTKDDPNDSFIVTGVIHSNTGQSIYSSISAYDFPKLASVASLMDSKLEGSAAKYMEKDHPAAKYLYVVKFARKCYGPPDELCIEIPNASDDPNESTLAYGSPVVFIERCYINPKTKSGPAVDETILPTLYHTRSKPRHVFQRLYDALFLSDTD
mmetsp:Transcript_24987/g.53915  ORF Transcript_24987/g.53915 Transcript_24987/m.53915 type:complete len:546 (-) Transcript_24987:30-1667(-)